MKNLPNLLRLATLATGMFFLTPCTQAQIESFTDWVEGDSVYAGKVLTVSDDLFGDPDWATIDSIYFSTAALYLEINPDNNLMVKDTFDFTVTVEVRYWDSAGVIGYDTVDLFVHFDTTYSVDYIKRSSKQYAGAHKIEATIAAVFYDEGSGSHMMPPIFRLGATINLHRLYLMNCDTALAFTNATYDAARNQLLLEWSNYPQATEYDLEWTFYDDSSAVGKLLSASGSPDLSKVFTNNSTRVTLQDNQYRISLIYPGGYVLYRIRAVKTLSDYQRIATHWSADVSDVFQVGWHEPDITWQFNQSFAEEGKRKEVATYFDGSLRNRQMVTRLNQVDTSVVGETIYDYHGRPAVQVLPTPTFNPQIRYFDKFNINNNSVPYNWQDFDTSGCGFIPGALLEDSGAARYYSSSNPLYNHPPFKYIPESHGYPFSITEYTPDNTGRLSRQSGVGQELILSSGHETKYYYGKPSQTELDRLFGNDVGDSSHYTQELVVDPNGQGSISYKDAHGRVIATALTGQPPHNLDTVVGFKADTIIRTYLIENNHREGNAMLSNTSFLAKSSGTFTFQYSLIPESMLLDNCQQEELCYDCYYDITITISSNCSPDPLVNVPVAVKSYRNYQIPSNPQYYFDTLCTSPDSMVIDTFTVDLAVGSYFINREVRVSDSALVFYRDRFLRENTCDTLSDFIEAELGAMDSSSCALTCETCMDQLGDTTTFIASFFSKMDAGGIVPSPADTLNALAIYRQAFLNCKSLCEPSDDCTLKRDLMLSDLTPGGQYAVTNYDVDNRPIGTSDASSIFFWDGSFYTYNYVNKVGPFQYANGDPILVNTSQGPKAPNELSISEFIDNFEESWAESMLRFHPEYCYLEFCYDNVASHEYDRRMINTDTYAAALDSGYFDPLYGSNKDPFFDYLDGNINFIQMEGRMHAYKVVAVPAPYNGNCSIATFSIWQLAMTAALQGFPSNLNFCTDTIDINTLCLGDKNAYWLAYKALYLSEKAIWYGQREGHYAKVDCVYPTVCGNFCIGGGLPSYQSLGHGMNCTGSYCDNNYYYKQPRFYHTSGSSALNWPDSASAAGWASTQKMDSICEQVCRSHRAYWTNQLTEYCGTIAEPTLTTLLDKFQEICQEGCDAQHMFGASSVPNGSTVLPPNFQAAMEQILGIDPDNACNAVVIDMPRPYYNQGSSSVSDIAYPKPSECTCEKFDSLFVLMYAQTGSWEMDSFALFLSDNYGSSLTVPQLMEIQEHCHDTICKHISEGFRLPAVLSCGDCLPCDSVANAFAAFKAEFPRTWAGPNGVELMTAYFNNHFAFHLDDYDYLNFMYDCNIDTTLGSGHILCHDIRDAFSDYLSSSPTLSLNDYLNQLFSLNYSYKDYSIWLYNCAFDTLTGGLISCDTLLAYRNTFYSSGVSVDSFVVWMNQTLGLQYNYMQYAVWIAHCDSTDSIPYSGTMHARIPRNNPYPKAVQKSVQNSKLVPTIDSKDQIRLRFEQVKARREEQLKQLRKERKLIEQGNKGKQGKKLSLGNLPEPGRKLTGRDEQEIQGALIGNEESTHQLIKNLPTPEYFITSLELKDKGKDSPGSFLASNALVLPENATDNDIFDGDPTTGGGGQIPTTLSSGFTCQDLQDALDDYANLSEFPPLHVWLNNYFLQNFSLNLNYSYLDYVAITQCGATIPTYQITCDNGFDDCFNSAGDVVSCLNSHYGLSFTGRDYLVWMDSCDFNIWEHLECSLILESGSIYPCDGSSLFGSLQTATGFDFPPEVWIAILDSCNIEIDCCEEISGGLQEYSCMNGNVFDHLNNYLSWSLTPMEYYLLFQNCELSYCELFSCLFEEYDCAYTDQATWLNSQTGWNLSLSEWLVLMNGCFENCCEFYNEGVTTFNEGELCDETAIFAYLNGFSGYNLSDQEWLLLLEECELEIECIGCEDLQSAVSSYDCSQDGPFYQFLIDHFSVSLTPAEMLYILQDCEISVDTCSLLNCWLEGIECSSNTVIAWLSAQSGWNLSASHWGELLKDCEITMCDSCEMITTSASTYPCNGSLSLYQWINASTGWSLTNSIALNILDSCEVSWQSNCINCDSLQDYFGLYPCNSGRSFYTWLNDTLNFSYSHLEWQSIFTELSCVVDSSCDSCTYVSTLIPQYPCDSLPLTAWLDSVTGWGWSDTMYVTFVDSCDLDSVIVEHCFSCDSLQALYGQYPCDSNQTFTSWLNDTLNVAFSDYEWFNLILPECPLDSLCRCAYLDSLVGTYPCHDSIPFTAWLDSITGWNYSDTTWIIMLDSCGLDSTWASHCIDCDSLEQYFGQFPCDTNITFTSWLNDTLNLSNTPFEWQQIFQILGCEVDSTCDSCTYFNDLIPLYPCDSLPLSAWLDSITGWGYPDTMYVALLDSCDLDSVIIEHCFGCDSLQALFGQYPCDSNQTFTSWLNDTLNVAFSDYEWFNLILPECPLDSLCRCDYLDSLVGAYPCHDSIPFVAWLDSITGWSYSDTTWVVMLDSCGLDSVWASHCIDCDSLELYFGLFPCDTTITFTSWLNDTLNLSYTSFEWQQIFQILGCEVDSTCDSCTYFSDLIPLYPCDSLPLSAWLDSITGWGYPDTMYVALLDSCDLDSLIIEHCFGCDSLQALYGQYPCDSNQTFTSWLNDTLNVAFSDYEWFNLILPECPLDSLCRCAYLDSLVGTYPCHDSIPFTVWLDSLTGWNYSDTTWIIMLDSCGLDSTWASHCIDCDSLELYFDQFPCDTNITFTSWLNDTLNLSYTEYEWQLIFQILGCDVDSTCSDCSYISTLVDQYNPDSALTLGQWLNSQMGWSYPDSSYWVILDTCGIECELFSTLHADWISDGRSPSLEVWMEQRLNFGWSYWDYIQVLDSCGIREYCDTLIALVDYHYILPEPKPTFAIWVTAPPYNWPFTTQQIEIMLDTCDADSIDTGDCATLQLYLNYYYSNTPPMSLYSWLNLQLGIQYTMSDYQAWITSCGSTPDPCPYLDSLYSYYVDNSITIALEQWLNPILGYNYTYWQYVTLLDSCGIQLQLPCDTIVALDSMLQSLPEPHAPFDLFANDILQLHYSAAWYQHLLDSCNVPPDTLDCDSLEVIYYDIYLDSVPQPDLTTFFNDRLQLTFTYWDYVQWFDSCGIPIPLPCDTLGILAGYYHDHVSPSPPLDVWLNDHFDISYTYAYYIHLLDSCGDLPSACDSLQNAIGAYIALADTSIDLTDFLNDYFDYSFTTNDYQQMLDTCLDNTNTLLLCDKDQFPMIALDSVLTEDCLDDFIQLAYSNAWHTFQLYLDSIKGEFESNYVRHCLESFDEYFFNEGPLSEYHYTLYYYDQAGMLVRTIPPNGVVPFGPTQLQQIANYRKGVPLSSPLYQNNGYESIYHFNTLNSPVAQETPDGGVTRFWYDNIGRIVASQQANQSPNKYSYTLYDKLGRIVQSGALTTSTSMTEAIGRDQSSLLSWIAGGTRSEVTETWYDNAAIAVSPGFSQDNLRSRIASVTFEQVYDADSLTYDHGTHYSYDIAGNVKTLIQENSELKSIGRHLKRIDYEFDLVTGKVRFVHYQRDSLDQFTHRYEYDDDNRIENVFTSRDKVFWDQDASYYYYMHGPLARLELGQQKVQGVDYAYTLQGWLKGINASQIDPGRDMGRDGQVAGHNPLVSRDGYGFSLGYFEQDFEPIGSDPFEADYHPSGGSSFGDKSYKSASLYDRGLYNGNIRHSVVALDSMNYPNIGYVYSYDQLNRLTGQVAYTGLDTTSNEWTTAGPVDDYKEKVTYDPNGNIKSYLRHGTTAGGLMDQMTYNYGYGSNNKLSHVDDAISAGTYPADIDDQANSNYTYDASGNLIGDVSEGITNDWTTAGKLQRVTKTGMVIEFRYDAMGNRVSKNVTDNSDSVTTYFVRDAQGNVMAVYQYADNAAELRLNELHMYGSSRVGIRQEDEIMWCQSCTLSVPPVTSAWAGRQIYELTNHLGNVLTTVSDKKVHFDNNNDNIADWSVPEIVSQNDYFPGGMLQPGRNFNAGDYRFGFNGQEKIDELSGAGNHNTAMYWEYSTRLVRRWNLDPYINSWESQYAAFGGNPVFNNDPLGDKWGKPGDDPKNNQDKNAADKLKDIFKERESHYKQQVDNLKDKLSNPDIAVQEKIELNDQLIEANIGMIDMQNAQREIDDLGNDASYYTFRPEGNLSGEGGAEIKDNNDGTFTYTIRYQFGNDGNKAHEVLHAFQWFNARNDVSYANGAYQDQLSRERPAYIRQYHTDPHSMPLSVFKVNNYRDINKKYLMQFKNADGSQLYNEIK